MLPHAQATAHLVAMAPCSLVTLPSWCPVTLCWWHGQHHLQDTLLLAIFQRTQQMTQMGPGWALTHLPSVAPVSMGTRQGQDVAMLGTTWPKSCAARNRAPSGTCPPACFLKITVPPARWMAPFSNFSIKSREDGSSAKLQQKCTKTCVWTHDVCYLNATGT